MKADHKALKHYRANPIDFIEHCLIDPETGKPFKLLLAERQFLAFAFKLRPDGRLQYPELVYACPKKSGKTTLAAIITLTMLVLYGGRFGEAICAANAFEQSVSRVFQQIKRIIEASPLLRADAKILQDKIAVAGAVITAIPSDYASAAGANPVISVFDELWAFDSERSRRLFDELIPPPTRKVACRLTVTYAGFSGESVLLEELYQRGMAQPEVAPGLRAGDGLLMAWHHEPVAHWQTEDWLRDMRRSLRPNQFLRMIENRWVTSESPFVSLADWDACTDPDGSPILLNRALPVWVGVDASVKHDSTAIVAVTFDTRAQKVRLVAHRVFQPSPDDPLSFDGAIAATVRDLCRRFNVIKVSFDPYQMAATSQQLQRDGIPMEEFPQTTANLTAASQNLFELVQGRNLVAYPDAPMRLAISRAVAVETGRGWRIDKTKQSHKIDVVVALAMACHAAVTSPEESGLWAPSAFLIDEAPAPWPTRAGMIFGVLIAEKGEAAVAYFARTFNAPLLLLDCHIGRLAPSLFGQIVTRLGELAQATNAQLGAILFTQGVLAAEFPRLGYHRGIEEIDELIAGLDDGMLELRASVHIGAGRMKICSGAFSKFHPARFLDPTVRDDGEPLKIAALLGVLLALDEERSQRPPPVLPPRRSPNANLPNSYA